MYNSDTISILFYILVGIGVIHFLRNNDEFIAPILLFFYSSCLNRFDKIIEGKIHYVYVAYARNIFNMTDEIGYQALVYLFVGTASLILFYVIFYPSNIKKIPKRDNPDYLRVFLQRNQTLILASFIVIFIMSILLLGVAFGSMTSGGSLALGNSYFYYFGFALTGMILLMFLSYRNLNRSKDGFYRILFLSLIVLAAIYTYDPINRFKLLSWIVAVGIILTQKYKPFRKLMIFGVGSYFVILFFSFLGAYRTNKVTFQDDFSKMYEVSVDRLNSAEDQNMLDGMMMMMQVYPQYLPFSLGMEHVEILLRPIPRSIWPNKPVGGYANKLGLNDNMEGATVGISPSIYGSFYAEAGMFGIILLCAIYAYLFVRIFKYAHTYGSDMQYIIKGIAIASAIPLLRGGDLPGIVAIIGMAYWPVFLFLYRYNQFLAKEKRQAAINFNNEQITDNLLKLQQQLKPESLVK